ncbi:hypothetical protein BD779DRAFT_1528197 [Infundibulicybe gibba]|nr:hypothetical protein BD779DRAFT_1528197 [Infundibulicybe gibba]
MQTRENSILLSTFIMPSPRIRGLSSKALGAAIAGAPHKPTPPIIIPADPRRRRCRETPDRAVALVPSSHLAIERRLKMMGTSSILRICTIIGEIGKCLEWQAYCLQTLPSGSASKCALGWARLAYEAPQNQTSKLEILLCFPPMSGNEGLLHHFHQRKVEPSGHAHSIDLIMGLALLHSSEEVPHMLILSLDFRI